MKSPFGGLLGDTCETRLLQFMLPMYGIEFDMADLVDEIGMTRQSIAKSLNKFAARDMVKIRKEGRTPLYSINEESPLVKRLEDFDNSLIESLIGAEKFAKIRTVKAKPVRKTAVSYDHTPAKASGVASPSGKYPVSGKAAHGETRDSNTGRGDRTKERGTYQSIRARKDVEVSSDRND